MNTKRSALETTVSDLGNAIADVARSVNAPVPSEAERDLIVYGTSWRDGSGNRIDPSEVYVVGEEDEDEIQASLEGPPLGDLSETAHDEHMADYDNEGWINEETEDDTR